MSDQLVPFDTSRNTSITESLTKTSDFLPQLRVYGARSEIVKEGKFPMGHFGLYFAQDKIVDMGEVLDTLVIDWRPRASVVMGDQPLSYYGRFDEETKEWTTSPEFDALKERAMVQKLEGHLCGLEYLLWFPEVKKYGLFLMGNPTLRRESSSLQALTGQPATLKIKLIKTKSYTWHGAKVSKCETISEVPDKEAIMSEIANFRMPKDSEVEMAEESESARAR